MKGRHRNLAGAGFVRRGNGWSAAARRDGPRPDVTPPALEAMEPRLLLAAAPTLAITEVNYKPYAPSAAETTAGYGAADFEFIEIQNIGDTAVDLGGVQLNSPVMFQFAAGQSLAPGQYLVVSPYPDAFRWRYGSAIPVVGPYGGHLPNIGAEIRLVYGQDLTPIVDFTYSPSGAWPGRANRKGSTLELKNPTTTLPSQYSDPNMWRSSVAFNGTPGAGPMANPNDVVVNEVLTSSAVAGRNFIELRNLTSSTLDLTGMYLSDNTTNYLKFRIPDGTTVAAGGQVAFWQGHIVGDQVVVGPGEFGDSIALDPSASSDLYLMATDASGNLARFVNHA
jgi:hypothetical protein